MNKARATVKVLWMFTKHLCQLQRSETMKSSGNEAAEELARLLGGKVLPNKQAVIGERVRPWLIPLQSEEFVVSVLVDSSTYALEMKCQQEILPSAEENLFCVSFKMPRRHMLLTERVIPLSKLLGVDVYRQLFVEEEVVTRHLSSMATRACLQQVNFSLASKFFLSPFQLEFDAKFKKVADAAQQVRVLRDLMSSLAVARRPAA